MQASSDRSMREVADVRVTAIEVAVARSPLGPIHVATREGTLCALSFDDYWAHEQRHLVRRFGAIRLEPGACTEAVAAVDRYFAGEIAALDAVAADPGGTPFQGRVWRALRGHPEPDVRCRIGIWPRRSANRRRSGRLRRPTDAIRSRSIIPCHRVIGSNGRLIGYGGGLERKAWLLRHEGARL